MHHFNGYLLVQYKLFFHYATFQWVPYWVQYNCSFIMQLSMGTSWFQYELFFHYATIQWVLLGFNINCSFIIATIQWVNIGFNINCFIMQHVNGYLWCQYALFFHYATFQWVLLCFNINCSFIMQQFNG